jgi:hypothetical protein
MGLLRIRSQAQKAAGVRTRHGSDQRVHSLNPKLMEVGWFQTVSLPQGTLKGDAHARRRHVFRFALLVIVAAERSKRRPAFSLWPVRPEALRSALRAGFLTRLSCSLGPQQYIRHMAYKGIVQTPIASPRLRKPAGEFAVWAATSGPNQYGPSARGRAEAVWGCATRGWSPSGGVLR